MKRFISTIAIAISVMSVLSQTITVSQLKNVNWNRISPVIKNINDMVKFTTTEFIMNEQFTRLGKTITQSYPYYLSETKTLTFDNAQVGKETKGRYLVVYVEQYRQTYCFDIISVSDDTLKISYCEGETTVYKK